MSIRNLDAVFAPGSIVLVGEGTGPNPALDAIARHLAAGGFAGPVLRVDAESRAPVDGLATAPDLAIIATPPDAVPGLVAALGARGCRAAVIVGGGMAADLRRAMLAAARPHLMRIVGPNSLGVIAPAGRLNASLAPVLPPAGDIALVSQSGAIVAALLDWAQGRGIGFSQVASLGDMSDVDVGDVLDHLAADPATRSILLYVENVTDARKFMSAARIAARTKPVLVLKAGRTQAGARAALSHTGALAGEDLVYDAAFRRAGLLRVAGMEELFDATATLATGLRVAGDRLIVLTNGGGPGVLAVDALVGLGGRLAAIGAEGLSALDRLLPPGWSSGNPVDILGDAPPERYAGALAILLKEREADAVLVLHWPTALADGTEIARAVAGFAARRLRLPVLTTFLGGASAEAPRALLAQHRMPTFSSPETAVRALDHLVRYRRSQDLLLETPSAGVAVAPHDVERGRVLIEGALAEGRRVLTEPESKRLLALFGIPVAETRTAASPQAAARLFAQFGEAVALKILSPDISHKSDIGGVRLGLRSADEVEAAARAMLAAVAAHRPGARLLGFTVQPMIVRPGAQELLAGIATDATFGPVIVFGRGGTAAEVLADRAIGLPPLNSVLALDMIGRTGAARLLAGFRDVPAARLDAVADVLVRLSELAVQRPEIVELDINPLLADADGVVALDARVVVAEPDPARRPVIRPYPLALEREITLRKGLRFRMRPIRPEDEEALTAMVEACTTEDLRLRFFAPLKSLPHRTAARFSQIDYDREMAFVAVAPESAYGAGPVFGVVRLISDSENETGEFAVLVRSDLKGAGLGRRLMQEILDYARQRGLRRIEGDVLRENTAMLALCRALGMRARPAGDMTEAVRMALDLPA